MSLSADNDANVALLMEWLRSDTAPQAAIALREELAYLLFYGDPTWATNDDSSSISDYRGILEAWLSEDYADESKFIQLTNPADRSDSSRDIFVSWFAPVVEKWKQSAKDTESNVERGLPNPQYAADQTPGTQYYWYDPDNEVYRYASTADAPDDDWLSYEDRRYTPVAYDPARETNFRQDVVTLDYEFQSRIAQGRWLTSAQWEEEVATAGARPDEGTGTDQPLYTVPVYDAGFEMYRRFSSVRGEYEYADDQNAETWMSLAQANARFERQAKAPAEVPAEQRQATAQAVYDRIVTPAFERLEESGHPAIDSLLSTPQGREWLEAELMRTASKALTTSPPN
jgi:hypothetical protein